MKTVLARCECTKIGPPVNTGLRLTRLVMMEVVDGKPTDNRFDQIFDPGKDISTVEGHLLGGSRYGWRDAEFSRIPSQPHPLVRDHLDAITTFLEGAILVSDDPDAFEIQVLNAELKRAKRPSLDTFIQGSHSIGKQFHERFRSFFIDPDFDLTRASRIMGLAPPRNALDLNALLSLWRHLEDGTWGPMFDPNLCLDIDGTPLDGSGWTVFTGLVADAKFDEANALLPLGGRPFADIDGRSPWLPVLSPGTHGAHVKQRKPLIEELIATPVDALPACLSNFPTPDLGDIMPFLNKKWQKHAGMAEKIETWLAEICRWRLDEKISNADSDKVARKFRL